MQQQLINNIIPSKTKLPYKSNDELSYKTMFTNTTGNIGDTDYNHSNDYSYDILGNLEGKSGAGYIETGIGSYNYNNKPYAISSAGGIATELGGGKFANGARTAAFVHLFNAEGGNIGNALTPDSVAVPGFEGKLGVLTVKYNPATLETNMHNPYNNNPVFSSASSFSLFGFGGSMTSYSYDLGQSWTTPTYDFISHYGTNPSGDFVYRGGIGFRRGRLDYQYDFEVPIIRGAH